MSAWIEYQFCDAILCNPPMKLKKGEIAENCEMEDIDPSFKFIYPRKGKLYKGGNAKFQNLDTLFARITPCLENGKIAQVKGLESKIGIGSTEFFVFRNIPGITTPDFVYYLSKSDFLRDIAVGSMTGASGRQRADIEALKKTKLLLPDIFEQEQICFVLNAYDDLIDVNSKRIKIIESTFQAVYKEWFVRLRFPGAENEPSENGIPLTWSKIRIDDIAYVNKSNLSKKVPFENISYIDISSVSNGKVNSTKSYELTSAPGRAKRVVSYGDTLFSTVRPENRAFAFVMDRLDNLVASTGFAVLTPKEDYLAEFIYCIISSDRFIEEMTIKAKGSAYPQVGFDEIRNYEFLAPNDLGSIILEFHTLVKPLFEQKHILQRANESLKVTRDFILPRLVSGKLGLTKSNGFTNLNSTTMATTNNLA
jgi:type I restriction enzyme S subunit